jgi:hypothetical protein
MSPAPLVLPVRAAEAMAVADVILETAERRPLADDVRNRVGGRLAALRLDGLKAWPGSLARDPVHASSYFIAVEGSPESGADCWLLRVALASAPASALFPNPVLITRSRGSTGGEIVISAIPFASTNSNEVRAYATAIDTAFLPRPRGTQAALTVCAAEPAVQIPAVFQAWRRIARSRVPLAAAVDCTAGEGVFAVTTWSAIRAGWRDGFGATVRIPHGSSVDTAREFVRAHSFATRWVAAGSADSESVAAMFRVIRETTSQKHFDFEVSLAGTGVSAAGRVAALVDELKRQPCPVQSIAPDLFGVADAELELRVAEIADALRPMSAALTVEGQPGWSGRTVERIGRAAGGRLNYSLTLPAGADAESTFDLLTDAASCLCG